MAEASKAALRLAFILCATLACTACSKSAEQKQREDAELNARVNEKLKSDAAAVASEREHDGRLQADAGKIRDAETRSESEATFSQFKKPQVVVTPADEARFLDVQVARLRARMPDPASMEVHESHFNTARTAVCLDVNYKNLGKDVGSRRAYVTPDVIWVEPEPDDVSHGAFDLNFKSIGC